jgi:hypothetical protein
MPDMNKLAALREAGFTIRNVCLTCTHFNAAQARAGGGNSSWGTCAKVTYTHLKHTGEPRQASVHASGSCAEYATLASAITDLRASNFEQFIEKPVSPKKRDAHGNWICMTTGCVNVATHYGRRARVPWCSTCWKAH